MSVHFVCKCCTNLNKSTETNVRGQRQSYIVSLQKPLPAEIEILPNQKKKRRRKKKKFLTG